MRDDKTWPRATHYFIKRRHWSLFIRRWVLWEWVSFVVHICSSLRLTLHFSDCVLVLFCRRPCCICNKQLLINSAQSITFISCSFCNGNQSQSEWHTFYINTKRIYFKGPIGVVFLLWISVKWQLFFRTARLPPPTPRPLSPKLALLLEFFFQFAPLFDKRGRCARNRRYVHACKWEVGS